MNLGESLRKRVIPLAYNSKYRKNIVRMILQGRTNRQISEALTCNPKLPQVTRRWWTRLPEKEQQAWITDNELFAVEDLEEEDPEAVEEVTGFNTPVRNAKGRFVISRY